MGCNAMQQRLTKKEPPDNLKVLQKKESIRLGRKGMEKDSQENYERKA